MQKEILKALLEAQKESVGITKNDKNKFANYNYVSAEDMVKHSKKILYKQGLAAGRAGWNYEKNENDFRLINHFFIAHGESGELETFETSFPVVMRKGMPEDKALSAGLTSSLSYWLRDILLIPRFNPSEDMDFHNDENDNPIEISNYKNKGERNERTNYYR